MTLALSPPHHIRGATFGLMAAMLFGISAPVSKVLLSDLPPLLLAALLYERRRGCTDRGDPLVELSW